MNNPFHWQLQGGCSSIAVEAQHLEPNDMMNSCQRTETSIETTVPHTVSASAEPWESLRCDLPDSSTLAQHPTNITAQHKTFTHKPGPRGENQRLL